MNPLKLSRLPQSWSKTTLGDVVLFTGGSQPPKKYFSSEPKNGYVRLIQIRDFKTDAYKTFIPKDRAKRFFSKNDIMIGRYGPPLFQILRGLEGSYNVALMKAEPKEGLHRDFLFYLLRNPNLQKAVIKNSQRTAGQTGVNLSFLNKIEVPLPPLPEQRRIASILANADALRTKRNQTIAKLDELLQSVFLNMFGDPVTNPKGWISVPLGKVVIAQGGYAFKSKDYVSDGVRLIKISNVHNEDVVWNDVSCVPKALLKKHQEFALLEQDVVLALTRPIIKSLRAVKVARVSKNDLPSLLNQRVARLIIQNKKAINSEFLLRWCHSQYFYRLVDRYCSVSLQPNISTKQIEAMDIYLPPFKLQSKFKRICETISRQRLAYLNNFSYYDTFFASLQHRAFKEEL